MTIAKLLSKVLHNPPLPTYHPTRGDMIAALDKRLAAVGYTLHADDCMDIPGNSGSKLIGIDCVDTGENVGYVNVSWYRMQSGRWELTAYIT